MYRNVSEINVPEDLTLIRLLVARMIAVLSDEQAEAQTHGIVAKSIENSPEWKQLTLEVVIENPNLFEVFRATEQNEYSAGIRSLANYWIGENAMETIKFSELPTGDRMPLVDEDGVPIIANQENQLLTWGRLKKRLATQTHADEMKSNESKVPTSTAIENRIAVTEEELDSQIETASATATDAHTKANVAAQIASEAKIVASSAKSSAKDATTVANVAKVAAESATGSIGTISARLAIRKYLR